MIEKIDFSEDSGADERDSLLRPMAIRIENTLRNASGFFDRSEFRTIIPLAALCYSITRHCGNHTYSKVNTLKWKKRALALFDSTTEMDHGDANEVGVKEWRDEIEKIFTAVSVFGADYDCSFENEYYNYCKKNFGIEFCKQHLQDIKP